VKGLGNRFIKGYEEPVPVFGLWFDEHLRPVSIA
jgi:hypothetical protein